MSRRDFLRMSAFTAAGLVAASCAGEEEATNTAKPAEVSPTDVPATPEEVTIRWMNHWGGPDESAIWVSFMEEFEAQNPGIKVEIENVDYENLLVEFMTRYSVGDAPDVYHFEFSALPNLVAEGVMINPDDGLAQEVKDGWAAAAVDGMTWEGSLRAIPTEMGTYGFMYSANLLDEAGVDPPAFPDGYTFDEYSTMVKQVAENTDGAGAGYIIQHDSNVEGQFLCFLWNNGGELVDADHTKALFNGPEGVEVLTMMKELIDAGAVSLFTDEDMSSSLASDKIGSFINANWWKLMFFDTYDEMNGEGAAQENFKISGIPWNESKNALSYFYGLLVTSQTEHPDEAWKVARYIGFPRGPQKNSPFGQFITEAFGVTPSNNIDLQYSPALDEPYTGAFIPVMQQFGRPQPIFKGYKEMQHTLASEIEAVYQTGKDPQAALDDAAAAANKILEA
jgi:multiple sugar transport system substrate-binding protein